MVDLDKFKQLMNVYHKELLSRLDKSELVEKLAGKLELNFERLTKQDLKDLIIKSVKLLGRERVYEILDVTPQIKSAFNEMGSFDEVESFIQASVTDVEILKSGLLLNNEFRKWLIELDELPEMAYLDDSLVFSWYTETSYGIILIVEGDTAILVRTDNGEETESDEYYVDDALAYLVIDMINEKNYHEIEQ